MPFCKNISVYGRWRTSSRRAANCNARGTYCIHETLRRSHCANNATHHATLEIGVHPGRADRSDAPAIDSIFDRHRRQLIQPDRQPQHSLHQAQDDQDRHAADDDIAPHRASTRLARTRVHIYCTVSVVGANPVGDQDDHDPPQSS